MQRLALATLMVQQPRFLEPFSHQITTGGGSTGHRTIHWTVIYGNGVVKLMYLDPNGPELYMAWKGQFNDGDLVGRIMVRLPAITDYTPTHFTRGAVVEAARRAEAIIRHKFRDAAQVRGIFLTWEDEG